MVDFSKLNDPAWQEEFRRKQDEEAAKAQAARDDVLRKIDVVLDHQDDGRASAQELRFAVSLRSQMVVYWHVPSEAQVKWLESIVRRLSGPSAGCARVQSPVEKAAVTLKAVPPPLWRTATPRK